MTEILSLLILGGIVLLYIRGKLMAGELESLQAAVALLGNQVTDTVQTLADLKAKAGVDPQAVQDNATTIASLVGTLKSATDAVKA